MVEYDVTDGNMTYVDDNCRTITYSCEPFTQEREDYPPFWHHFAGKKPPQKIVTRSKIGNVPVVKKARDNFKRPNRSIQEEKQ